jgi:kynurenine 3-monooxygenase
LFFARLVQLQSRRFTQLNDNAVGLLLPTAGKVTAFVEPTARDTCCVLFAVPNEEAATTDPLFTSQNVSHVVTLLSERFPKFRESKSENAASDVNIDKTSLLYETAQQLVSKTVAKQAEAVECNTFHLNFYGNDSAAVLVGDAAHATGGVSGQGLNSALIDSIVLIQQLVNAYSDLDASGSDSVNHVKFSPLHQAMLRYSKCQVPEAVALKELALGAGKNLSVWQKLRNVQRSMADSLFKGRFGIGQLPLQTKLTTSLESFASIRRKLDRRYASPFPSNQYFHSHIDQIDANTTKAQRSQKKPSFSTSTKA